MKLGICNLTGTDINETTNSNSNEIVNICKQLNSLDGIECDVLKNSFFNSESSNSFSLFLEEDNKKDYDAILIMNSHPNFFGGVRDDTVLNKFKFLAKFNKPLFYLYNDKNLPFEQLWKSIEKRSWNDLKEEDVRINPEPYLISQFKNYDKFIDFGVWKLDNYKSKYVNNSAVYDLIYGGSFRGGRREKKFYDFFFNKDLNVAFYGTIKLDNFKNKEGAPKNWLGKINSSNVIQENSLGFSTIIVGEKGYNDNIEIIRIYESILAGCITFIDNDFDSNHVIYPNCDYLYIKSGEELENKIKELKINKELYDKCILAQNEYLERKSKYDYKSELILYIKEKLNGR